LAVAEAYRPALGGLAGKLRTLKAESHSLAEVTGGNLAHSVFPGLAAFLSVRTNSLRHARTLLTGDAADADLHNISASLKLAERNLANRNPPDGEAIWIGKRIDPAPCCTLDDIIRRDPALAYPVHQAYDLDVLGMLLIAMKGILAIELGIKDQVMRSVGIKTFTYLEELDLADVAWEGFQH